jgi:hypothetical protein
MDESGRALIGLVTGLLIFSGAVLSFVNARLSEAREPDARARVVVFSYLGVSFAFLAAAMVATFFYSSLPAAMLLLLMPNALQVYVFLKSKAPLTRAGVVTIGLAIGLSVLIISVGTTLYLVNRMLDVQGRLIDAVSQIAKTKPSP